jgi:hypothetical protein
MFQTLNKKNNKYISLPDKSLRFFLSDVKIKSLHKYANNKGYLIKIFIPEVVNKDVLNEFKNIDDQTIQDISVNSSQWFNKNLSEEEVQCLHKPMYCSQSHTIEVILSNNDLTKYILNNKPYVELDDIITVIKDVKNLKNYIINIDIQHIGLYIYQEEALHKWIIKNIYITDTSIEKCHWEKEDIEEKLEDNINDISNKTNQRISMYHTQINTLVNNTCKLYEILSDIKKLSGKKWETKIDELNELIESQQQILNL